MVSWPSTGENNISQRNRIMYELKDNFLEDKEFKIIQDLLMGPALPWFSQGEIARKNEIDVNGYFIHTFFLNQPEYTRGVYSNEYKLFETMIQKINMDVLIRLRANNYPRTEKKVQHSFHVDYPFPHKTAIFGINTNNGCTIIEKNKKIKSKENRIIFLDGETKHCSTTCTDVRSRVNVIINYV